MAITGLTSATPNKLLLDAGAFFLNYDLTKSYAQQASTALLGATAGGGSFSAVPQVRKTEIDGGKTNIKGLEQIDGWVVTMTANVKEITAQAISKALGAIESKTIASGDSETGYVGSTKITGKEDFADADYANNLTWVGRLSGSTKPVVIVLKNALSLNGLSLSVADKAEAVIPITVTGHYSLNDLDTPPFEIIYPN